MVQKCALSARRISPCVPCPVAQAYAGMALSLSLCVLIQSWLDLDFPGFLLSPDRSRPPADSETDHIATVMFRCTVNASTHSHRTNSTGPRRLNQLNHLNQCSPFRGVSLVSEYLYMVFSSPQFSAGNSERFTALGQGC